MTNRGKMNSEGIVSFIKKNRIIVSICAVNFIIHSIGITWGLPNFDSWAIDSVVPSGVLKGLAKGYSFGFSYHYPIVHLVLLGVLIIPVLLTGAVHALVLHNPAEIMALIASIKKAAPLEQWEIVQTLLPIKTYTTSIILVGNIVTLFMSIGVVYMIYLLAREIFNEKTGLFAAALLTFNVSFNYYSHTGNLDVPYIFWGLFALYHLLMAVRYNRRDNFVICAITTVLCFGTKDQGYALFVLPFIIYLVIIPFIWKRSVNEFFNIYKRNFVIFVICFIAVFVVAENLILNFNGFIARIKIMTGVNSEGYTQYTSTLAGYKSLFRDFLPVYIELIASWPVAILTLAGVITASVKEYRRSSPVFLPLISAISFMIFFVLIVKRADHRFLLAPSILLSVYAGYLLALLFDMMNNKIFWAVAIPVSVYLMIFTFNININLLMDTRYRVTEWMEKNIPNGSKVEHYEDYVYLPQFPSNVREYRIKKDYDDVSKRNPDYIIISSLWYKRFFKENIIPSAEGTKIPDRAVKFEASDQGAYVRALLTGGTEYVKAITFTHSVPWPFKPMHVTPEIVILQRKSAER